MSLQRIKHISYRLTMGVLARIMRSLMRIKGIEGSFAVNARGAFYEDEDGVRHVYDFARFGAAGNIDSGGTTEPLTRKPLADMLPEGGVFYDIGAHQGVYSMYVMRQRPDATVVSFEPQADNLRESLKLNALADNGLHAVAVGDQPGNIGMTVGQRSSNHVVAAGEVAEVNVPIIKLDDYCASKSLPMPDIIKLDIEGLEFHALRGARNILRKSSPLIVAEINHCFHRYTEDFASAANELRAEGYGIYARQAGKMVAIPDLPHETNQLPASDEDNYWFIPERWNSLVAQSR